MFGIDELTRIRLTPPKCFKETDSNSGFVSSSSSSSSSSDSVSDVFS
jgi:hypothetical protein